MKKLILLCLFPLLCYAQAPIPTEVMFGNNRANLLLILNRPIDTKGRFHFFNVTVGAADYQNTPSETEIVLNNSLTYALGNNFHAAAGAQIGIRPYNRSAIFEGASRFLIGYFSYL
jgi:hypothetical protein